MNKKALLAATLLASFFILNYLLAFFLPAKGGPLTPIWFHYLNQDYRSAILKDHISSLETTQRLLILTASVKGSDANAMYESLLKEDRGNLDSLKQNLDRIGTCTFNGVNGSWEFYIYTYSFFNIPISETIINCNNGLVPR